MDLECKNHKIKGFYGLFLATYLIDSWLLVLNLIVNYLLLFVYEYCNWYMVKYGGVLVDRLTDFESTSTKGNMLPEDDS